jgi:hypothetical protein
VRLGPGDCPRARHAALALLALLLVGTWWLRRFPEAPSSLIQPCLMRSLTGLPCPTCGGTRAMLALSRGSWLEALAANPLVTVGTFALAAGGVAALVVTVRPRWRRKCEASPGDGRRFALVLLAATVASWIWVATS